MTECSVIHIHASLPQDPVLIQLEFVALEQVVVDHGCKKIIGSRNGVKISGEVEVDIFHGDYL